MTPKHFQHVLFQESHTLFVFKESVDKNPQCCLILDLGQFPIFFQSVMRNMDTLFCSCAIILEHIKSFVHRRYIAYLPTSWYYNNWCDRIRTATIDMLGQKLRYWNIFIRKFVKKKSTFIFAELNDTLNRRKKDLTYFVFI